MFLSQLNLKRILLNYNLIEKSHLLPLNSIFKSILTVYCSLKYKSKISPIHHT